MTDLKLKPCPFCGGEAYSSYGDDRWYIRCFECGAYLSNYMGCDYGPEAMKKCRKMVIDKWNRRINK